jgi:glucose/mannose-6-phosphate isomerase
MTDLARTDSEDLMVLAAAMPEHIEHAIRASQGLEGLPEKERVENVVILGMGDSAMAGDALVAAAAPFMPVPVTVVRSYELPAFVGEGSLVFAISYSGNTEEIIEAVTTAATQGAKVVAITSGGSLAELASGWGAPVVRIPKGIPQARAAFGLFVIPPIVILEEIGLFPGARQWVDDALEQVRRRRDELAKPGNVAERIAGNLHGRMAVVTGGGAVGVATTQRWKAQINQNAKSMAYWAVQPELCHNEVVGWDAQAEWTREKVAVVALRHDGEHPQVTRRFDLVHEHIAPSVASIDQVRAEGEGDLAQLLDLVLIGDYVSIYLAALNGVDPGPVPFLSVMKAALSQP